MLAALVGPDDVTLAHAHNRLGHVLNCADDIEGAIVAHGRALDVLGRAGRDDLRPPVLTDLGYTLWAAGRLEPAGAALRAGPGRAGRARAGGTAGTGRTPPPGWAWSSRTAGSSPRPSATSGP